MQGLELKANILQSVSRWAATKFLSHWEYWHQWSQMKKHRAASQISGLGLQAEDLFQGKTMQTSADEAGYLTYASCLSSSCQH